jgi:hypothetical protein
MLPPMAELGEQRSLERNRVGPFDVLALRLLINLEIEPSKSPLRIPRGLSLPCFRKLSATHLFALSFP